MADKIVLPLTLTDLAQSLRELLGLTTDLAEFAGGVSRSIGKRRRSRTANLLGRLGFTARGSKGILAKIAAGHGSQDDLAQLKEALRETDTEVDNAIAKLAGYGPFLEKHIGLEAKWNLESLVHEAQHPDERGFAGKMHLRREIRALSEMHYEHDRNQVQWTAQMLLHSIEEFNRSLLELYDRIRSAQA